MRLGWEAVGGDPAPGDPGAFDELAQRFAATAGNAREAHGRLSRLAGSVDESIWRGEAADAFRAEIAELPPLLAKLHDSYQAASQGMAAYGGHLRELQAQARGLLAQTQAPRRAGGPTTGPRPGSGTRPSCAHRRLRAGHQRRWTAGGKRPQPA